MRGPRLLGLFSRFDGRVREQLRRILGVGDSASRHDGSAVVGEQPVADGDGVGGDVGELVQFELHEHQQPVEPGPVAEAGGAWSEPVLELVEQSSSHLRSLGMPVRQAMTLKCSHQ